MDIYSKFSKNPSFLLLGQQYLTTDNGENFLLADIIKKYSKEQSKYENSYNTLFELEYGEADDVFLAWVQQRCDRLPAPIWLDKVATFPWSGLITTAIDTVWQKSFVNEWRELQHIYDESFIPLNPRNRTKLHCTHLFGSITRSENNEKAPVRKINLIRRRPVAISLARRIKEYITPLGVLAIEGYSVNDWLTPDELFPIIDELDEGQVHLFSATAELLQNEFIQILIETKKIITHTESLGEFFQNGINHGKIKIDRRNIENEFVKRLQLGEESLEIPTYLWNQVSRSAIILEDSILKPPPTVSKDRIYQEYRTFLSDSGIRPIWSGYARSFVFPRDFERELLEKIEKGLLSKELQKDPVILQGKTGTGKTISLGSVAYKIRSSLKYPVLFIERRPQKPLSSDIDAFCKWAEDNGSSACLVVWDGMIESEQYYTLLNYLSSRGRKVVLVGSDYKHDENDSLDIVLAPDILSSNEQERFKEYLQKHELDFNKFKLEDPNFLVQLYRYLPVTHRTIRLGIEREVGTVEKKIMEDIGKQDKSDPELSQFAEALVRAGVINKTELISNQFDEEIGGESFDTLQKLIGLIMVPSKFGLKVPLELLIRALGKGFIYNFNEIINKYDIFRYYEDVVGNILVGARHSLEAQLITQYRYGSARTEVDFVKMLILNIKESPYYLDNMEIQFAFDLIRNIGPNGNYKSYYESSFTDIADSLKELREKRGIINPRLMLHEANLLRESTKSTANNIDVDLLLENAEQILYSALEILEDESKVSFLKGYLMVELASISASRLKQKIDESKNEFELISLFKKAQEQATLARRVDPKSFYPIDITFWASRDILRSNLISEEIKAETKVELLHIFELMKPEDFSGEQQDKYFQRKLELGNIIGSTELSQSAFNSLVSNGSKAGFYLTAIQLAGGNLFFDENLTKEQVKIVNTVFEYLQDQYEAIKDDGRCLFLLFKSWWLLKNKVPMFYGERQTVGLKEIEWQYGHKLLLQLANTEEFINNSNILFFLGMATFHLNYLDSAMESFRDLEQESEHFYSRRRIIRSYLASTPEGKPRKFTGTVNFVSADMKKGEVYVEQLRRNIKFIPHEFNNQHLVRGESLTFHIAFNFRGAIADPIYYAQQGKGK